MAIGDTQRAFARAAAEDGIVLVRQSFPWICQQGHFGLVRTALAHRDPVAAVRAEIAAKTLERICVSLGGDLECLRGGRPTPLPGDFLHLDSGVLIEVDELQHFTSFRLQALNEYLVGQPVGYDLAAYRRTCETSKDRADHYRAGKAARCFGAGGRQRQRAYYDSLRDLAAPAMGHPPVVRCPALQEDGARAYRDSRDLIRAAVKRSMDENREPLA